MDTEVEQLLGEDVRLHAVEGAGKVKKQDPYVGSWPLQVADRALQQREDGIVGGAKQSP